MVRLFFPLFLSSSNFEFPARIKKGGGIDPPDPLLRWDDDKDNVPDPDNVAPHVGGY